MVSISVSDPPGLWADLGFVVDGHHCVIDEVRIDLGTPGDGIVGWSVAHLGPLAEVPTETETVEPPRRLREAPHPNGVQGIDHLVVRTPDVTRSIDAIEAAGLELRRTQTIRRAEQEIRQAFFKLGRVILEVVGPPVASAGPASFYGLALLVGDLDVTAGLLGSRLRPPHPAHQKGRRIAELDRRAGSAVPMAFLSPR